MYAGLNFLAFRVYFVFGSQSALLLLLRLAHFPRKFTSFFCNFMLMELIYIEDESVCVCVQVNKRERMNKEAEWGSPEIKAADMFQGNTHKPRSVRESLREVWCI